MDPELLLAKDRWCGLALQPRQGRLWGWLGGGRSLKWACPHLCG